MELISTYEKLIADYRKWLELIGYAASTAYKLSNHLREFLEWQQAQQKVAEYQQCRGDTGGR